MTYLFYEYCNKVEIAYIYLYVLTILVLLLSMHFEFDKIGCFKMADISFISYLGHYQDKYGLKQYRNNLWLCL